MKMSDMEDDIIFDGIQQTKQSVQEKKLMHKTKSLIYGNHDSM